MLEGEQQLVEAAKLDANKFLPLYEYYFEAIYRYVFRRINEKETTHDIVAQTFTDALEHLKSFEWRGYPFSAWLYRIAHNNVAKWYRDNHKTNTIDPELIKDIPEKGPTIGEKVETVLSKQQIEEALKQLDADEQEIVKLKYFEEMPNKDIATILKLTPNNVAVKLFRALKKMRQYLPDSYFSL